MKKIALIMILSIIYICPIHAKEYQDIYDNVSKLATSLSKPYFNVRPNEWGEKVTGVITKINTDKKLLAITLDACGGKKGSEADIALINFLIENNIKATLFLNTRWIAANRDLFKTLSKNDLFEIENHGTEHRPLSVTSREIYGISGTGSPANVVKEVEVGGLIIEGLTNRKPKFFRSGTAYYDNIAVEILERLGYKAIGFTLNADKGATLLSTQVEQNLNGAKNGDIIIAHMNRPKGGTMLGFKNAIPKLKAQGFEFVKLNEVELK